MIKNRKKLPYVVIAIVIILFAMASTTLALYVFRRNPDGINSQNTTNGSKLQLSETAKDLKLQASEAFQRNDLSTANKLFQEARKIYNDSGDTRNVADIDVSLSLINHLNSTPSSVTMSSTPAATK